MPDATSEHVLDAYALLLFLQKEPGWETVRELLRDAAARQRPIVMSAINIGEVYYRLWRTQGEQQAKGFSLHVLPTLPITRAVPDYEGILRAAQVKARNRRVSYADCFCAALAIELGATVVTGDPEFKAFEPDLKVLWLP